MNTERIVKSVEPYRAHQSKLIAGVWLIERRLVDRVVDGISYTMDYGVKTVLVKHTFATPVKSNSKAVKEQIERLIKMLAE